MVQFLQTLCFHFTIRLHMPLLQRTCVRMCAHMYAEPITLVLIINDRQCNEVP